MNASLNASRHGALLRLRNLILLALGLTLAGLAVTAALMYRQAFEDARAQLDGAARIAQEHALKMLETNEMLLARMLDLLGDNSDAAVLRRGTEFHERLKEMARELPQVQGLYLHGADSRSLGTSRVSPPPRDIDYSDREWYRFHSDPKSTGLFITEQLRSRATGEPFFDMSRRRILSDGSFAGTVHASIRPEYLTAFWQEMDHPLHGLHLLVAREDGRLVARWPGGVPEDGGRAGEALRQRFAAGASGHFEADSPFDGVRRVGAYRKLGEYPLYVTATFDRAHVVAGWARNVGLLALFVLPLAGALAAMGWLALRRTREEMEAAQRLEEETARRQRSELALAQAQKLETVGQLAGGVAHDFNNLLMIVANNLHLLRLRGPRGIERELEAMERAVGSGTRLTRQLLALAGRQTLSPERVLLQERLSGILSLARATLPANVELQVEVAHDTAPVFVDAAELELALINLVLNARDAMPGGGRLAVAARNAAEQVVLEVSDTGTGMDAGVLERISQPFFTTKAAGKGSGLGLTQVRALCRASGGTLGIDSRPGEGTTVRLMLPRAAPGHEDRLAEAGLASPAPLHCALLLVEDNDALAVATTAVLESLGCRVQRVENARAALDALEEALPDVVLSDIEMPGRTDGIELAARLAERQPPVPVVLMSGYAARIDQAKALRLDVLAKPCSAAAMRAAIAAALARGRPSGLRRIASGE